eukprot:15343138-Ditylum_brightwellii.AAC.1
MMFDKRLNPADINSLTASHSTRKLNSNDVKQVLMFIQVFHSIATKAAIPQGPQRWTLFKSLLLGSPKSKWTNRAANVATCDQPNFQAILELWLTDFMTVNFSEDILEWIRNLQKPKDMSVNDFAARLNQCNEL